MPRPRRKPRPPGNAVAFCTGRGAHKRKHLRRLQLVADGGRVAIAWDQREGPPPETGFRAADGRKTFELVCPVCQPRRHFKRREDDLVTIVVALGRQQGLTGSDNTPVEVDISLIERA